MISLSYTEIALGICAIFLLAFSLGWFLRPRKVVYGERRANYGLRRATPREMERKKQWAEPGGDYPHFGE